LGPDVGEHRSAAFARTRAQLEVHARQTITAHGASGLVHADCQALLSFDGREIEPAEVQYRFVFGERVVCGGGGGHRGNHGAPGQRQKAFLDHHHHLLRNGSSRSSAVWPAS
jgi:hypothetical protein